MLESIQYTVIVAPIATAVSTTVGTISAIGLTARPGPLDPGTVALEINNLPVMNPTWSPPSA